MLLLVDSPWCIHRTILSSRVFSGWAIVTETNGECAGQPVTSTMIQVGLTRPHSTSVATPMPRSCKQPRWLIYVCSFRLALYQRCTVIYCCTSYIKWTSVNVTLPPVVAPRGLAFLCMSLASFFSVLTSERRSPFVSPQRVTWVTFTESLRLCVDGCLIVGGYERWFCLR